MMDDRQLMENLLLNLKGECDLLMHGAVEASTPEVHNAFSKAFNDTLKMQSEVYSAMAQKGWYPSSKAEQQKVDALKQKYSSGC